MKPTQLIFLLVLFTFAACQPNKTSQLETTQTAEQPKTALDTIIFRTSSDQTVYVGKRILPQPQVYDSAAVSFLKNSEITTVIEAGDSLFIFLNNDMLVSEANEYFPQINDSLIQYHYSKIYEVEIDDDLPYFAYFRSDKDNLVFTKDKDSGEFTWSGVVTDTVMSFMNDIKIGTNKASILESFNISNIESPNLTIILCHASTPSRIWYKSLLPELRNYEQPTTTMLLRIENNILTGILIDFWICYGKADEILLRKLNEN
jgi:hypothetical protein